MISKPVRQRDNKIRLSSLSFHQNLNRNQFLRNWIRDEVQPLKIGKASSDNMNEVELEVNLKFYFSPISFYNIRQTQWVAETNGFYFFCLLC